MSETKGIKETTEVLEMFFSILEIAKKYLLDGVQVSDIALIIIELLKSDGFQTKLNDALENMKEVPSEMLDLKGPEMTQLAFFCFNRFQKMIKI
jgi:hypothetical protein